MSVFAGYAPYYDEQARLTILKALSAQSAGRLNDTILLTELQALGFNKGRDYLHQHLAWLEESAKAIKLMRVGDTALIAEILEAGEEHVQRRRVLPGVGVPSRSRN